MSPRRTRNGVLPIKGILISHVPGVRLSCFRSIPAEIACKVIEGLSFIHSRGVLHRDVKKRNVLIVPTVRASSGGATDDDDIRDALVDPLDGGEDVFWIDFSNSLTVEGFWSSRAHANEASFASAKSEELREASKMVDRLQR